MTYKAPYKLLKVGRGRTGKARIGIYLLGGISLLLLAAGIYTTTTWVTAGGIGHMFASQTPTASITPTPTNTPTVTNTPTITPFPNTPTASAPFTYNVELGDTISSIADKFDVDFIIIMVLNGLNNDSVLQVGQELIIPDPNMEIPAPTALPANLRRGDEIQYLVLPGDTLAGIANQFLSTVDDILAKNNLDNPNQIFVGQLLTIRVFLVTATPGPSPTPQGTAAPTATPTP